ncbi:MAG: tRNA guanosine(34) transglycosylase Tgt [Candidatus Melainabacteria bacterium]|nr:tRNA guanosine(34) transglycosylase Tgt [Candidatus Melainabacteria bacterium]
MTGHFQQFEFKRLANQGEARAGLLHTPHGSVETPVFMPVGTHSAVRGLTRAQLLALEANIILGNAYHLFLRPGPALVARAGGLHGWMNWQRPILTDSGGFQVFSLASWRKMDADGVTFKDPITGSQYRLGPKESMAIQNQLGADIMMAFDDCPPYPVTQEQAKTSLETTQRWLDQCFTHHQRPHDQALFPIVQGSVFPHLRDQAAAHVQQYPAHGYAIGGVSVGEPPDLVEAIVRHTAPQLPADKPRYLMGVGTPEDLLRGIRNGIDMFDCVMPTRIARHGSFFTRTGRKIIKNLEFSEDFGPLDEGCDCEACQHHSRAYLRHLYRMNEQTAKTLLSIHNLRVLIRVAQQARQAILKGQFEDFYQQTLLALKPPVARPSVLAPALPSSAEAGPYS